MSGSGEAAQSKEMTVRLDLIDGRKPLLILEKAILSRPPMSGEGRGTFPFSMNGF